MLVTHGEKSHYGFVLNYWFIGWLNWVFITACGLSLVEASGGFSLWWRLLLRSAGSRPRGLGLVPGFNCPATCGTFPDPGMEPKPPALPD